ncbi:MAG: hypothetical protein GY775_16815 [Candidatus Scalindua sp.]|nr:hypothetical protein [Candidatus Scalindua sp.]
MFKKKVKLKIHNPSCDIRQKGFKNGNWTDLAANGDQYLNPPNLIVTRNSKEEFQSPNFRFVYLPLGVSMTLPKWYGAEIKPRSSTFKNFGIIQTNSVGEVEAVFSEEWRFPSLQFKRGLIENGERFCQFQIKLLSEAPWYMKIADLFVSGFKYEEVDVLTTTRGGLGSTGTTIKDASQLTLAI